MLTSLFMGKNKKFWQTTLLKIRFLNKKNIERSEYDSRMICGDFSKFPVDIFPE